MSIFKLLIFNSDIKILFWKSIVSIKVLCIKTFVKSTLLDKLILVIGVSWISNRFSSVLFVTSKEVRFVSNISKRWRFGLFDKSILETLLLLKYNVCNWVKFVISILVILLSETPSVFKLLFCERSISERLFAVKYKISRLGLLETSIVVICVLLTLSWFNVVVFGNIIDSKFSSPTNKSINSVKELTSISVTKFSLILRPWRFTKASKPVKSLIFANCKNNIVSSTVSASLTCISPSPLVSITGLV